MAYLNFPTLDSTTAKALPGPSSFSTDRQFKFKTANFGDRYTQSAPDGLNFAWKEWSIEWSELFTTEKDTIMNFLDARQGAETFNWVNPANNTTYKIRCKEFTDKWVKAGIWSITAKFVQVPV